jgi:hypothetical protein
MNLWRQFDKEQYDRDSIDIDGEGYVTYNKYDDGSVYVHHMFVTKEKRNQGICKKLEMLLVKKENPTAIHAYVDLVAKNPHLSLLAFIQAGYKISGATSERILIYKSFITGDRK